MQSNWFAKFLHHYLFSFSFFLTPLPVNTATQWSSGSMRVLALCAGDCVFDSWLGYTNNFKNTTLRALA